MRIQPFHFVLFSGLSILSLFSHAQFAPPRVEVVNQQFDGSGCDASNARSAFTQDLTTLSVLYDNYSAEIGKGTSQPKAKSAEKKCSILIDIVMTPGWTFTIDSVEYRGFIESPNKSTFAYHLASLEMNGGQVFGFDQAIVRGPFIDNHSLIVKNKSLGTLNTKNCDGSPQRLRIKSLIGVRNLLAAILKPAVKIGIDSVDGKITQRFAFNWKKCGL